MFLFGQFELCDFFNLVWNTNVKKAKTSFGLNVYQIGTSQALMMDLKSFVNNIFSLIKNTIKKLYK